MAQKHNWSKKKGDAWCTRKGCDRMRRVAGSTYAYSYRLGLGSSDLEGACAGDVPKTEKGGRHDWRDGAPDEWRECCHAKCLWEFNARAERYRQRGRNGLAEIAVRKPAPCKGGGGAVKEHDWGPARLTGIRLCKRNGCAAEWAVDPVVKDRPYYKHDGNGWSKNPGECRGTT